MVLLKLNSYKIMQKYCLNAAAKHAVTDGSENTQIVAVCF